MKLTLKNKRMKVKEDEEYGNEESKKN